MKICFVCHANICRSFLAQEILKSLAARRGRGDVTVFSRGVYAREDLRPPQKIKAFLAEQDINYDNAHTPALISRQDIENADLVLVMTKDQLEQLADKYSEHSGKIHLFLNYACGIEKDTEDPVALSGRAFERIALKIKDAVHKLMAKI